MDDTSCTLTLNKNNNYQNQLDTTLSIVADYMIANKLIQNEDKTQLIVLSKDPSVRNNLKITTEKKDNHSSYKLQIPRYLF